MIHKQNIQSLSQECLDGKYVLVRANLNVPIMETTAGIRVGDDTRIKALIPTINFLSASGAKIILCSHLGRPQGKIELALSLQPVAKLLQEILLNQNITVHFVEAVLGPQVEQTKRNLNNGDVMLLENLHFYLEERENDAEFAAELAKGIDIFVNEAFGLSHKVYASTVGVAQHISRRLAGYGFAQELLFLQDTLESPDRPLAAIVGGAKVSTKLAILRRLLDKVDTLVVAGGLVFTFYRAMGYTVGDSLVEENLLSQADEIIRLAEVRKVNLLLASDSQIVRTEDLYGKLPGKGEEKSTTASYLSLGSEGSIHAPVKHSIARKDQGPFFVPPSVEVCRYSENEKIPDGFTAVDIGPETSRKFRSELEHCKTILWNGPMGICERPEFNTGTVDMIQFLSNLTFRGVTTLVCGVDTVDAVEKQRQYLKLQVELGLKQPTEEFISQQKLEFTHISAGGGAALQFLEGRELPGVMVLEDVPVQIAGLLGQEKHHSF